MMNEIESKHEIACAVEILNRNLSEIARVNEWAEVMGYANPQAFAYCFVKHFGVRPFEVLRYVRVKSIAYHLRKTDYSNLKIAHLHGLPEEKALNQFMNYHLGYAPTRVKEMSGDTLQKELQKLENKIKE